MTLGNQYEGWNTKSHLQTFNVWNRQSDIQFNFAYGNFAEQRYLRSAVGGLAKPTVLDVGCATGTTYRFLRNNVGLEGFDYLGLDLSEPAVEQAKSLYPKATFVAKDRQPLAEYLPKRHDIVFSRDTILHQTSPYEFLTDLLSAAEKVLIVRLRTRDNGDTVLDTELSCQMHYDQYWMPYIVLNTDELVAFLQSNTAVRRITMNRSYEILGGQNYRYLPKDLYFTSAGGAETAVMIELDRTEQPAAPAEVVYENALEGHAFLRRHRLKRYFYAALSRALRPGGQ
ncbi:MAG: class I SAM-dependent methyltransferase [Cypionkella sp.]